MEGGSAGSGSRPCGLPGAPRRPWSRLGVGAGPGPPLPALAASPRACPAQPRGMVLERRPLAGGA